MQQFYFTVVLDGYEPDDDQQLDRLVELTHGDASFSFCDGHGEAFFSRRARDYERAVDAAVAELETAGVAVVGITRERRILRDDE